MEAFTDANEEAEDSEAGAAEVACKMWCSAEVTGTATGMVRCSEVGNSGVGGLTTSSDAVHSNTEQEFGQERGRRGAPRRPGPLRVGQQL